MKTLHFFLGGRDLETVTITQLLNETWPGSPTRTTGLAGGRARLPTNPKSALRLPQIVHPSSLSWKMTWVYLRTP